jgi:hypothetical protein
MKCNIAKINKAISKTGRHQGRRHQRTQPLTPDKKKPYTSLAGGRSNQIKKIISKVRLGFTGAVSIGLGGNLLGERLNPTGWIRH